jgi:hypothetical protein
MDLRTGRLLAVLAASTGCQTVVEDLPSRPTSPLNAAPILVVVPVPSGGVPAPAATPTPTPTPAAPTPAPTATPTPERGPIDSVRVAFFGINCKDVGKTPPNNGRRELPVGCIGYVTATPKDKNNVDVPASVHGPDVDWELRAGSGIVDVLPPTFPNVFNKDLRGRRTGEFSLCATVKGVQGCLNGTVTP